ncbi:MAG: hypothetical protein MRERV_13c017 [Mycoplasmataceae bacterium RV_VA103A]|nr:MAG: hypothetical protein MRERV_13c017 [Mycoplasmataceae bacterium RV_VA103A]
MESNYLTWEKGTFLTEKGYLIRLEMKLMRIPEVRVEFPEGYKFRWIVYNVENTSELVRLDNHRGKPLHLHIDDDKKGKPMAWVSLEATRQFFFQQVYQRFGYFDYE